MDKIDISLEPLLRAMNWGGFYSPTHNGSLYDSVSRLPLESPRVGVVRDNGLGLKQDALNGE